MTALGVYCYTAADGVPLYVGQTDDMLRRDAEHRRSAPWWQPDLGLRVLRSRLTDTEADLEERRAVLELRPVFNVERPDIAIERPSTLDRWASDPRQDPGVYATYPREWRKVCARARAFHKTPEGPLWPTVLDWSEVRPGLDRYAVRVADGQTLDELRSRAASLTTAIGAQRVALMATDDPSVVALLVDRGDVWAAPLPWIPPKRGARSVVLVETLTGRAQSFRIPGRHDHPQHWGLGGQTRAGKSVIVHGLVGGLHYLHALGEEWGELWGIDLKGGVELGPWERAFTRLSFDRSDAVGLLQAAVDEMERRFAVLHKLGAFTIAQARGAFGALVVVVDELAELVPCRDVAHPLLESLAARGLAAGVVLFVATQSLRAAQPVVIPPLVRDNLLRRLALATSDPAHTAKLLGEGSKVPAHELSLAGTGYLVTDEAGATPDLVRGRYIAPEHVPHIARLGQDRSRSEGASSSSGTGEAGDDVAEHYEPGQPPRASAVDPHKRSDSVNDRRAPSFVPLEPVEVDLEHPLAVRGRVERGRAALWDEVGGTEQVCVACGSSVPWKARGRRAALRVVRSLGGGGGLAAACVSCVREQSERLVVS